MWNERLLEDLAARRQPGRCSAPHLAALVPAGPERDQTPIEGGRRERVDVGIAGVESVGIEGVEAGRVEGARVEHGQVEAERGDAERLIADLEALVAAGLVVVESHVLGPARYAVGPDLEDAA